MQTIDKNLSQPTQKTFPLVKLLLAIDFIVILSAAICVATDKEAPQPTPQPKTIPQIKTPQSGMSREEYLKTRAQIIRYKEAKNARHALMQGFVPFSIKKEMVALGISDIKDMPVASAIQAAESGYYPNEGIVKGLDAWEIEAIRMIAPERARIYDKLEPTRTNQRNLQLEKEFFLKNSLHLATDFNTAIQKQGNKITRFFMSEKKRKERDKNARFAKQRLDAAWDEYRRLEKNKIAYRTILLLQNQQSQNGQTSEE